MVFLRIILKEFGWIILGTIAQIRRSKISFDASLLETNNIRSCTIPGITNGEHWLYIPPSRLSER
jgi:hypothetical protein